nr:unnamed protein product [Callosobruchus analis]
MDLASDIKYPAIPAAAFYRRKKLPNLDAAADFITLCSSNDIDVVILPPDPDMLTDQEDIDEDNLESTELPSDVPSMLEVFMGSPGDASEDDFTEWDDSDTETLASKRVKLLSAKEPKSNRSRKKDPSFVQPNWQQNSVDYTRWQPMSDGASERARIVCEDLENLSPKDIFEKLVDDKIIGLIVEQSELYAHQKNNHAFSLTTDDLKQFLGILFFTGYHRLPRERSYWSLDEDLHVEVVSRCMSRNRYLEIKKYLHINNNAEINNDRMYKLRPLMDMLNANFQQWGIFHKMLSVDEAMVKYYDHHSAKQFIRDPQNTSAVSKQWIALVVGHELAHQWFGNLVTMEWWTHLWLNEGYASFVEFLCVNFLFPEYDIWTQFVNDSYIKALELDSLKNSHPIEVPVGNPSEIDEIFDDISYNKGASVIRMLHHYIGDADFRKGMHLYLTRHQYGNTFTEDLWAALEEASNKPVKDVMSTWTKQMGFPVVKVTSQPKGDGKGVLLTLTQSKFTADGSEPEDQNWMVPIGISTSKDPSKEVVNTVLKTRSAEVVVPDIGPEDWIKVNPGTIGFYRTQYTSEMLEKFITAIRNKTLPPIDRLGLVDDLFAMVKAGHTNTIEVLKLLKAYEDETDYNVWSSAGNVLGRLTQLLDYTDCKEDFKKYQKHLLKKVYIRLGWNQKPGETHLDTLLRGLVLGRLAWLDDENTVEEARKRFIKHAKSEEVLPADLRSACYKTVLRAGGKEQFETLLKLYRATDLHEEKDRIGRSLGAAKDPILLGKVLEFAMSDTVFVISAVAVTKEGRELAWKFFKNNWDVISARFSGHLLHRLVKYLTESFASEEIANEVEKFFAEHKAPGCERVVQQSIETIHLNAAWLKRDSADIKKYLTLA